MAFDAESVGGGAGAGLIVGILTALGLKGRVEALEKNVLYKDTCKACSDGRGKELALLESQIKDGFARLEKAGQETRAEILKLYAREG